MEAEKIWFIEKLLIKLNKPKLDNKVAFYRLLAVTQNAWLWIRDSLDAILNWEQHPWMRKIVDDLISQTSQWTSLADAMENHAYFFWHEEIALVKSAETMWNLPDVLQNLSDELENFQQIKWKLKSALMYPSVVLVFTAIAVVILLIYVMPTMVDMFPSEEDLPWITLFMMGASDFLQDYWFLVLLGVISLWVGYKMAYTYLLPFKIFMDKVFLKAPIVWNLTRSFNLYRFSKLLWDFYNAWVWPTDALEQISEILSNYHYSTKIKNVKNDLSLWLWFVESMEWSWLFDPILIQIIWIWENTWNVWEVLEKISSFYRDNLDQSVEWLMKALEPLIMAFVAIVVWVIVASIFLPMWELIWTIW